MLEPQETDNSRTIALVLGKSGVHFSVDGAPATPLELPVVDGGKLPLTPGTLLDALDHLLLAEMTVDLVVIGTRADGTAGWDNFDTDELESIAPAEVHVSAYTEAGALNRSVMRSTNEGDLLVCDVQTSEFAYGKQALGAENPPSPAYAVFATIEEGGRPRGSVRWWSGIGEHVEPETVWFLEQDFGPIYTLPGASMTDNPSLVASLVHSFLAAHPNVTTVFIWDQDGLAEQLDYMPGGRFWGFLRFPDRFREAGGKIVIVATALTVATLTALPPAPVVPAMPAVNSTPVDDDQPASPTADTTEAGGGTTDEKDDA